MEKFIDSSSLKREKLFTKWEAMVEKGALRYAGLRPGLPLLSSWILKKDHIAHSFSDHANSEPSSQIMN